MHKPLHSLTILRYYVNSSTLLTIDPEHSRMDQYMAKKAGFKFHKEFIQQLVTLSTSAFGLAAALAWNETIQQAVKDFIEPKIPGSGLLSRLIYALLVTLFAVIITFELSRLASRWGIKK